MSVNNQERERREEVGVKRRIGVAHGQVGGEREAGEREVMKKDM
jgi:hypothetical protein